SASVRAQRGFTLTELMVTVAVAGVLAMVAVPNMRTFLQNNRLSSASNDLLRSFNLARTEAIKHQANVVVCAVADPTLAVPVCSYGPFKGWIVFQDGPPSGPPSNWQFDAGEPIFERHVLLDSSITVKTDNDGIEMYLATASARTGARATVRATRTAAQRRTTAARERHPSAALPRRWPPTICTGGSGSSRGQSPAARQPARSSSLPERLRRTP